VRRPPVRLLVCVAACAAMLAGAIPASGADWRQYHAGPSRRGVSPETWLNARNIGGLRILWSRATGASKEGVNSSPAVAKGIVYVGSDDGRLWAFKAAGGSVLWSRATGDRIRSSPAVADGVVYIGSDDGRLYAFDAVTGTRRWSRALGGRVTAPPLVAGGRVFVGSRGGTFFALDAKTGKVRWRRSTWSVWNAAAYRGGTVYVGSDQEEVYAFDASSGKRRWTTQVWGRVRSAPAVTQGRVFVGTDMGRVYALGRTSGRKIWNAEAVSPGNGYVRSSPAVADGRVFVSLGLTTTPMDGKVRAFRADTGARLWTGEMADYSTSSPAVVNGLVIAGSFDRQLYAYRASTGAVVWSSGWVYQGGFFDRGISSSPAIGGGRLYVGVRNGRFYALGLPR